MIEARPFLPVTQPPFLRAGDPRIGHNGGPRIDDGVIAYWDWTGPEPFRSKVGDHLLVQGAGSSVTVVDGGPSGKAILLDGVNDYLEIAAGNVGDLNIGGNGGNEALLAASFYRTNSTGSFIHGSWKEDNAAPARQYGMFAHLPLYGGDTQVCGHISKFGGATPGYPYSRDYSANSRKLRSSAWEFAAMTYDGAEIRSYLAAMFDHRPTYTDNQSQTYSKNPYPFASGLNTAPCPFTVGAVKLTAGMGNFFGGMIGPIWVIRPDLATLERSPHARITDIYRTQIAPGDPLYNLDLATGSQGNARSIGWQCATASEILTDIGSSDYAKFGQNIAGAHRYIARGNDAGRNVPMVGFSPDMDGVNLSEIGSIKFTLNSGITNSNLRVVIKSGNAWYASDETFDLSSAGVSGSDWSAAVEKTFIFNRNAAKWRDLTFTPGAALSLAGSARSQALPDAALQNVGFYSPSNPSAAIRIKGPRVFANAA